MTVSIDGTLGVTAPQFVITNGAATVTLIPPVSGTLSGVPLFQSASGALVLTNATGGTLTLQPAVGSTTATSLAFPNGVGASGQVLTSNGTGGMTWGSSGGGLTVGSTTIASGATGSILIDTLGVLQELVMGSGVSALLAAAANGPNGLVSLDGSGALPVVTNGTFGSGGSTTGTIDLYNSGNANALTIQPGATSPAWTLTLPIGPGNAGEFLQTDGSGNTVWAPASGSGTVNSGTANQIAYYSATGTAVSGDANVTVNAGALTLGVAGTAAGSLVLSGSTSQTVTIKTAATAGNWNLTLPATAGAANQVLQTDGAGITSWVTPASGITVNTTTITGGTSGNILYNNANTVGEKTVTGTGSVVLATSPTITTGTYTGLNETKTTIGTGAVTIDCASGNVFATTLSASITGITFSNVPAAGTSYSFTLSVTSGGAFSITWPGSVKWPGGTAPTLTSTAGKVDTFTFYTFDAGATWYGFAAGLNA